MNSGKNIGSHHVYQAFLKEVTQCILESRNKAIFSVNTELISLHWQLGTRILDKQSQAGWGRNVIGQLAADLKRLFPDTKGYSERNLTYMRRFAQAYPDFSIVQAALAKITWYHNLTLLEKVADEKERLWYAQQTIEQGWSRNVLVAQIESGLYSRQAVSSHKVNNFASRLPTPQSDLAHNTLKDPYLFNFLTSGDEAEEKELEKDIVQHITQFMLELGKGFAYVGRQYPIQVADKEYYLDLLFYNLELRAFMVVELKRGEFKPEYAGKLNFYLSAVDELLKKPQDNPSIGLILCKSKNKAIAEYALKDMTKPMGVAEYRLMNSLPKNLGKSLPTIEELEETLNQMPMPLDDGQEKE